MCVPCFTPCLSTISKWMSWISHKICSSCCVDANSENDSYGKNGNVYGSKDEMVGIGTNDNQRSKGVNTIH